MNCTERRHAEAAESSHRDAACAVAFAPAASRANALPRRVAALIISLLAAALIALPGCSSASDVDASAPNASAASTSTIAPAQEAASGDSASADGELPAYAGEPAANVGDGVPDFGDLAVDARASNVGWESYAPLDELGRCGAATACLGPETMPPDGDERGSISEVKPTGWNQAYYDTVDGGALWNRCHLIAWSLSDEDANECNLVTGARSMNNEGMLPYEEEVARYIDRTGNHVLYRATPVFEGEELVCRGVRIEAQSVEDNGAGVSFDVFCFNVQPGIVIDYATGTSHEERVVTPAGEQTYVLNTSSMKFHYPDCDSTRNMNSRNKLEVTTTRDELIERGYEPCGSCRP